LGVYCGAQQPPKELRLPANAAAVVLNKVNGGQATFSAKWKKIKGGKNLLIFFSHFEFVSLNK